MPHIRARYVEPLLKKALKFKGIVGVFGHRQVGKTTLLEKLTTRYTTLDLPTELQRADANPVAFIEELSRLPKNWPVAIDECQLSPALFPVLKDFVRRNKQPGIFLLSGSVRFSSRKAIRESLTGRLLSYELLPFSISELDQKPINTLARDLLTADFNSVSFQTKHVKSLKKRKDVSKYLSSGGLPGICFVRNNRDRADLLASQINLILDRDLRLVCDTDLSLNRLLTFVKILAENQNQPLNYAELKRRSRVSEPTLKKLLVGLEAIFFIRTIPTEGDEVRASIFFEDQGEAFYLSSGRFDSFADLERLAFSHLRIPFAYESGLRSELFQYRRRGGAYVPFVFRTENRVIGFICTLDEAPSLSAIRSGQSLKQSYPGAKVVYLHPGTQCKVLNSDEASLPIELFL